MYYNHQVDDWEYSVTVSEGITCKTSRGSSSSLTEMSLKIEAIMWYNVILVKLLDKFTRITLHALRQNRNSFTQSSEKEILIEQASLQIFRCTTQKSAEIVLMENFPVRELGIKSLHSTECGNFLNNLHEFFGTSLDSCQLFFVTFSVVRFVIVNYLFVYMVVFNNWKKSEKSKFKQKLITSAYFRTVNIMQSR